MVKWEAEIGEFPEARGLVSLEYTEAKQEIVSSEGGGNTSDLYTHKDGFPVV